MTNKQNLYYPILLMLMSTIAFSCMNAIVKYMEHITAFQLVFFRAVGTLVLCIIYLQYKGIPLLGKNRRWLLFRAIAGTISLSLYFKAIKLIPLGSAVTLRYMAPIFAAILAYFLLKERIKKVQWLCFLAAFIGVCLLKGFDFRISTIGFVIILSSAFFTGLVYFSIKKIGQSEHPLVIIIYFMFIATAAGLGLSISDWQQPSGFDLCWLLSLGVLGFFGQLGMTMSIQQGQLTSVIPLKYTEALLSIVIGAIWFGEGVGLVALVGILLIIGGMVLNILLSQK